MVYYSDQADTDLDEILKGLLHWKKFELTYDFCHNYVSDIIDVCDSLDAKTYHRNAVYPIHKKYGEKVYAYQRNKQTIWYIVYDIDLFGSILVNKIISNHLTI